MISRSMVPLILITLTACASAGTPTGTNTNGTAGGTTGGTGTTSGGSGEFGGSFTPVAAIYEGNAGGVDDGQFVINLLSTPMDCATWQDANSSINGTDLQLILSGGAAGQYTLVDPNQQSNAANTGVGVDVSTVSNTEVAASAGNVTIANVTAGGNLTGSMAISWNDGETLTVPTFTAQYCTDTNTWGGTFAPQSALFEVNGSSTVVLLFDQQVTCDDWQNDNVPYGVTSVELIIGATAAGTYALQDPNTAAAGAALAYETFSNATVSSTAGSVTLSAVSSTGVTVAVPSVKWSSDANSMVASYAATQCNL